MAETKELKHPDGRIVRVEPGSQAEKEFTEAGYADPSGSSKPNGDQKSDQKTDQKQGDDKTSTRGKA
jgi:hypothetical protein